MTAYGKLSRDELIRILLERDGADLGGIRMTYAGQTPPWQIVRRVEPRSQKLEAKLSVGPEEDQSSNVLMEGENLQALVSLYKYRGQVDLILTDPPYNTGLDFRYNDRWDEDPNDPDLGKLVPADDGSRHSKWVRFMTPRLWMMKEMLRPGGVLAICIDHRELFRLGMLLDEIFGERNRVAIINWQKSYAPKNNVGKRTHVSTQTEYVLVYTKSIDRAVTNLLPRTDQTNSRYGTWDDDPDPWKPGDLTGQGADTHRGQVYGVQSPFTGKIVYPSEGRCWAIEKAKLKKLLEAWGSSYVSKSLNDGCVDGLVIKGSLEKAKQKAEEIRDAGCWPVGHWRDGGLGTFGVKKYLKSVKQGMVPTTFWSDDDYEEPLDLGSSSWSHEQSGHSQAGINELAALVGRGNGFETVKPLKLFTKVIQIWCPPNGIVLDPFAGSGTTGHAVMHLNAQSGARRRFVLIEQGRPERGDPYARTLTKERLESAITGRRYVKDGTPSISATPLPGGFRYSRLMSKVDAAAVLALEREEMIDLLLTSHWDQGSRSEGHLRRLPAGTHKHLFARSVRGEGFFLVWNGPKEKSVLNREAFRAIAAEAAAEGLSQPYHVYARISTYGGPNVEFNQIPNKVLEKLGFNEAVGLYGIPRDAAEASQDAAS